MDFTWIKELLGPGSTELASTLVLYSFVIAVGVFLGKLKIGSVSLGVTFVLFVGILMGHFGYVVDPNVLKFVREFGLILFIFAIGIQVGPAFAQEARGSPEAINTMSMGYAAAYPLGVCGILGAMFLIKALFKIRTDREISAMEEEYESAQTKPNIVSIEVTNNSSTSE